MNKLTQDIYRKIYNDLMNSLKNDNTFQKCFNDEQIKFIEQNWCKKLEENHILLNTQVDICHILQYQNLPGQLKDPFQETQDRLPKPQKNNKIEQIENSILKKKMEQLNTKESFKPLNSIIKSPIQNISKNINQNKVFLEDEENSEKNEIKSENNQKIESSLKQEIEFDFQGIDKNFTLQKKEKEDSDVGSLFDDTEMRPKQEKQTFLPEITQDINEKDFQEKIQQALKSENQKNITAKQQPEDIEDEEESLNSKDDPTDYENEFDTGKNMLLAYYEKTTRKKDKRKITLKHCILRIEEMEMILPQAKGDFTWVAAKQNLL